MNLRLFEIINAVLKYSVVIGDMVMTIHCFFLVMGLPTFLAEYITGHCLVGAVELILASFLLKFCWLYRSFVIHNFLVYTCIVYEREVGFGTWLTPMRYIMLFSGILLLLLLIRKELCERTKL